MANRSTDQFDQDDTLDQSIVIDDMDEKGQKGGESDTFGDVTDENLCQ